MYIKTLRWKVKGFGHLLDYVDRDTREDENEKRVRPSFRILHNLRPSNLSGVAEQFRANDEFRRIRKNGVTVYHEVLSIHPLDRHPATPEILEDLARKYIELRCPDALVFAAPHFDTDHAHVQLCISGTEFRSPKTLRMNNQAFRNIRNEFEAYQREHYSLELPHSVAYDVERNQKRRREDVEKTRTAELEKIQKSKTDRHLEQAQALPDMTAEARYEVPELEAEAAALEMEAEAEALQQQAEMEAQQIAEEQRAEAERQAEEAARIQELEAIQAEQQAREQERDLERG